jgi:hypothetical protein
MVLQRQPPVTEGKGRCLGCASCDLGAGSFGVALDVIDVEGGSDGADVGVVVDVDVGSDKAAEVGASSPVFADIVEYLDCRY